MNYIGVTKGGVFSAKNSTNTEVTQVKDSVRIYTLNIVNQNKKLREYYTKIDELQKSLINELEGELKIAERRLQRLINDNSCESF